MGNIDLSILDGANEDLEILRSRCMSAHDDNEPLNPETVAEILDTQRLFNAAVIAKLRELAGDV